MLWNVHTSRNQLQIPYIVYSDTECPLVKSKEPCILHKHVPNSESQRERSSPLYIHVKNIAHLFNLGHNCIDADHRYCPICSKQVSLKEYDRHISLCYEYSNNLTLLTLPEQGRVMEFTNFQ